METLHQIEFTGQCLPDLEEDQEPTEEEDVLEIKPGLHGCERWT